jgi:UPF0755 protein
LSEQLTPFDAESYKASHPPQNQDDKPESDSPEPPEAETTQVVATEKPGVRLAPWLMVAGVIGLMMVAGLWWRERERARLHEWRFGPIVMPEKVARVPEEWTAKTLSERLEKSGKVREAQAFAEAAEQVDLQLVQPGAYLLPEKAGPLQLAQIFKKQPPLMKVTFPEGWTAARMAERLKSQNFNGADAFRQAAYPSGQPVSPWEGKLFPDTYYLPVKGSAQELAEPMKARYREITAELPRPFPNGPDGKPLSLQEITILASLIERETHVSEERAMVAGVLYNRLRKGMRLQIDATVQYARERAAAQGQLEIGHKERLLYRDLEISSPYNTYRNSGLPPGPICNPGRESLLAAVRPKQSEYFFYVLSPKLDRHRFAKTFSEHQRNIRLARQERG